MEQVAGGFDHNVVIVSVADTKDICGDAVTGTRSGKVVYGPLILEWRWIVFGQPVGNGAIFERARQSVLNLDTTKSLSARH